MEKLSTYTLKSMIERSFQYFATRPALSNADGEPITYADLQEQIKALQVMMTDLGISKGDRVALLSQNMPNWGIAYLAIATMGAVAVPILIDFHVNEILQILKHSGAKLVFVSSAQYEKIAYADLEPFPLLISMDNFEPIEAHTPKDKISGFIYEQGVQLTKLKNKALKATGLKSFEVREDDLAAIIYTSGTTGSSKGVMLSHKNIVYDAHITMGIQKMDEYDRLISVLPLPHTYEFTIGFVIPMMQGACVYYLDKPPTARVLIPAVQKIKPTMLLTVPLIIEKIFKLQIHPQLTGNIIFRELYKLPPTRKLLHKVAGKKLHKTFGGKLHFFGIGGALLSEEVERFLFEAGFPYAIGYGLTETSPLIAGCSPFVVKFRSTGTVLDTLKVRIHNPDPKTGIGEIQVKGDTVMLGYYKDKQRTDEVFTKDGYFKTGDLGILKKNNYLYIKGRIKNVIIAATGENIYPEEIEAKINEDENVLESLVYESAGQIIARVFLNYEILDKIHGIAKMGGVDSEKLIQKILNDIKTHVNNNVAAFSRIHKIVEQKEPFEKTPTQKIKRFLYQ
ncbi:MAG: AMP-binding protein [Candidatus Cloacimonadaceae bacterium]|nr:AMP-binding protein [Candidatus Cloacimonadaceae bacterium]